MARVGKDGWGSSSLKRKEVHVEELGGDVLVRELPASYSAELNQHATMKTIGREQIATIDLVTMERLKFAYGVIGDDGNPLFTPEEAADIAAKHGRAFKVVLDAIDELSEVNSDAIKEARERFPDSGAVENGSSLASGRVAAGDGGPDVPTRAGA